MEPQTYKANAEDANRIYNFITNVQKGPQSERPWNFVGRFEAPSRTDVIYHGAGEVIRITYDGSPETFKGALVARHSDGLYLSSTPHSIESLRSAAKVKLREILSEETGLTGAA